MVATARTIVATSAVPVTFVIPTASINAVGIIGNINASFAYVCLAHAITTASMDVNIGDFTTSCCVVGDAADVDVACVWV